MRLFRSSAIVGAIVIALSLLCFTERVVATGRDKHVTENFRRPYLREDESLTYHHRRPDPSAETLAKFDVRRITNAAVMEEVAYGPFIHFVLVYADNERSRNLLQPWYSACKLMGGKVKCVQADAVGTNYERSVAGKIAETPLPALFVYDDIGTNVPRAKLVSTQPPADAEGLVQLMKQQLATVATEVAEGQGQLKHGGTFSPNEPTGDL
jgi:hypothetical protein